MGTVRGSRPSRPSRLRPSSQRCLVASNFTWQPPFAISLPYSSLERNFCCQRHTRQKEPEDDVSAQETGNRKPPHANPHCRASPPSSSLERDFCRRRQAPQKEPEADVSKQRPEIGDYHAQNSAAKTAFLLASYQLRVSEDCLVETRWIETECPPLSLSNESPVRARNGNFQCRD